MEDSLIADESLWLPDDVYKSIYQLWLWFKMDLPRQWNKIVEQMRIQKNIELVSSQSRIARVIDNLVKIQCWESRVTGPDATKRFTYFHKIDKLIWFGDRIAMVRFGHGLRSIGDGRLFVEGLNLAIIREGDDDNSPYTERMDELVIKIGGMLSILTIED